MSFLEYSEELVPTKPSKVQNCNMCPYFTTSFFLMVSHVNRHKSWRNFVCENTTIERYRCKDCNFESDLTLMFKLHLRNHHSIHSKPQENAPHYYARTYICENCAFESHFSLTWLQHTLSCGKNANRALERKGLQWHKCDQCDSKYASKSYLKIHKIVKHLSDDDRIWYRCEKCPFKAKVKFNLKTHYMRQHVDERDVKWFKCEKCLYKTKQKPHLRSHILTNHLDENEIKWFECRNCSYRSKTKIGLKTHVSYRHLDGKDVKWYECEQCPFKSKHKGSLNYHVVARHTDEKHIKWYDCKYCSYKSKVKLVVNKHIKKKHADKEKCRVDNVVLKSQINLRLKRILSDRSKMPFLVYSKAHTKSSPKKIHKCGRCPYFTTWYFLMVSHLKRHKWPRIFTCDKATVESYYCKDCNYQTTVTLLFILHVRKHHSIKKQRHEDPPQYSVRKYICGNCPFESHFSMTWYQHTFSCHKTKQIQEVAKQGTVW
ncbi:zinc finger protein 142-like [Zophobas morio]|uniref:zinc finger protein 142-like n=1 Tax=Zophobas morio TaxID=2755281 RepID=UPI0030838E74